MKVVKVYGALKKRLGQGRFEFDVATPAEAVRALCANFPGLQKWIIDSEQDGIGYKVKVGKEVIEEDSLEGFHFPWSERDVFSIRPVLTGAGRGWGRVLVGALLIGASFMFPGAGMFGTTSIFGSATTGTFMAGVGTFVSSLGASIALGGVAEMISPVPKMPDMKEANNLQNYSFSAVTNTAQVGTPIPIAYGRLYVGSSVVSSGLDVDQVI